MATVLEAPGRGITMSSGNGSTWNNEVARKVRLRVEPDGEPAFEWSGRLRFQQSHEAGANDRIWVIFDPADHERLMLDTAPRTGAWGGVQASADALVLPGPTPVRPPTAADPIDQLEKLADLRDRGVLTPEEFEDQKRRLLDP